MMKIVRIEGREILDSRGNPTVEVELELEDGTVATAGVPSGASTGKFEAVELRDGDKGRYGGKGVLQAVGNVNGELREAVLGMDASDQRALDEKMIALDGTENKGRLGANAILGISLAAARAEAISKKIPLYRHIRNLSGLPEAIDSFPVPMFNVINGGKHSDSGLSAQEFKLVPSGIGAYPDQLRAGSEIFHVLKGILEKAKLSVGVGDEGGFAPHMESHARALETLHEAITAAGYVPGKDVFIGFDVAASSFYEEQEDQYRLQPENVMLSRESIINVYRDWMAKYSVVSIEDGLHEEDWSGWAQMKEKLEKETAAWGRKVMLIGDDLLVTNPKKLARAIEENSCNAVLIKTNQIGTLTETLDCMKLARENGYDTVVSHRSGETCDDFIADLAIGASAGFIKTGSLSRGERLAKYNRMLRIYEDVKIKDKN
ncbi:MAG: phosphopyruvate hydratase [Candidatus Moranbacteria bacterium]|nr:phosphopyruvate hydratase [Candidatus Moranbacteria bacterium]